ncbi:hypothetical protein OIU74_012505, partial [Salix koriyanagi]
MEFDDDANKGLSLRWDFFWKEIVFEKITKERFVGSKERIK